jgi:RNA polymerase sigma-70 factor (ECF subfamily)
VAEDPIERWLITGRAAWPEGTVVPAQLAAHLERLEIPLAPDHAHAADLYLACACATGSAGAVAAFDRELTPVMRAAVRKIDPANHFVDEVVQVARERLLVSAPGTDSRIADYAGQGPLRAWVRIAAMRIAMNLLRDRRRNVLVDDDRFFELATDDSDAERRRSAVRYGEAAADAMRAAFASLSARERNLLRMHHLHGLTVDELAPTFRVHRATVARWLASAREHLLAETRAGLRARLAIGEATVDSILRELAGHVDVSVVRMLSDE